MPHIVLFGIIDNSEMHKEKADFCLLTGEIKSSILMVENKQVRKTK